MASRSVSFSKGDPSYFEPPEPCAPQCHRFVTTGGRTDSFGDNIVTITTCENCGATLALTFSKHKAQS